jgi:F-type H+-transporting ATPase subunit delta
MVELSTLARPYAEAIFDLAKETQRFEAWSRDLAGLTAIIEEPLMAEVIGNPRVARATLTRLLIEVVDDNSGYPYLHNLIKLLVENRRLRLVPHIATQFEELKAQHQGYVKVQMTSPYPVSSQQQQEIEAALQKRLGKAIDVTITIDETLVGGWIIRAGDEVLDLSIKGRLQQLATELRH